MKFEPMSDECERDQPDLTRRADGTYCWKRRQPRAADEGAAVGGGEAKPNVYPIGYGLLWLLPLFGPSTSARRYAVGSKQRKPACSK